MPRLSLPKTSQALWVQPEHLNVSPHLLGQRLATPQQRGWAMLIDVSAVGLLSTLGNVYWLVAVSLALWLLLRRREPQRPQHHWLWALVLACGLLGSNTFWHLHDMGDDKPHQAATKADEASQDDEERPDTAAAATSAPGTESAAELEQQLKKARRQLKELRQSKPSFSPRAWIREWEDEAGLSFGWALFYFTLLPAVWPGQTLGKRLLGLRVAELTGKPAGLMLNLKRYGGYAAGMATGGLGFIQIFWDQNRQAIQDKTAHTVVVDLRHTPAPPAPSGTEAVHADAATASAPAEQVPAESRP